MCFVSHREMVLQLTKIREKPPDNEYKINRAFMQSKQVLGVRGVRLVVESPVGCPVPLPASLPTGLQPSEGDSSWRSDVPYACLGLQGKSLPKRKNLAIRSLNEMVPFDREGEKKKIPHLIKFTFRVSFKENWRPKPPEHQPLGEWRMSNEDAGENRWKQTSHRNGQSVSTDTTQLKRNNTTTHKNIHADAATGS